MTEVDIDRYDEDLSMADSQNRAAVLVRILQEVTPEEGNALLREWFNLCDALAPWAADLREQFTRCGWVGDSKETLLLPVTVYRGAWADDDVENALSWTTDIKVAQQFCKIISGPRGWFLGIKRDDSVATVFRGTCISALGYITGRAEHEVIADEVVDIEKIQELRTVKP